ncbi:MAG: hypothetical protein HC933_04780 [Pleurocapsa sp. SU_196_0]|nr:hypothetical protein [Pleurocapsa sp. SU_196_0]
MKNKFSLGSLGLILAGVLVACPMPAPPPSGAKVLVQNTVNGFQVAINTKATFYATVQDTSDQRVTWSIDDASNAKGTIAQNGEYTAPATVPSPDKVRIRATSVANPSVSGFLEITIVIQGGIAGTINIPAGLLSNPGNAQTQASSVEPAKVFTPDWDAPRVKGQFLIIGDSVSVVRTQSASASLQRARVQAVSTGLLRVETPAGESDAAFAAKVASETGARVQPNYLYKTMNLPNDPEFAKQAYLTQIDAQGAWSVQTGALERQPDRSARYGREFCSSRSERTPQQRHGFLPEDHRAGRVPGAGQ